MPRLEVQGGSSLQLNAAALNEKESPPTPPSCSLLFLIIARLSCSRPTMVKNVQISGQLDPPTSRCHWPDNPDFGPPDPPSKLAKLKQAWLVHLAQLRHAATAASAWFS